MEGECFRVKPREDGWGLWRDGFDIYNICTCGLGSAEKWEVPGVEGGVVAAGSSFLSGELEVGYAKPGELSEVNFENLFVGQGQGSRVWIPGSGRWWGSDYDDPYLVI